MKESKKYTKEEIKTHWVELKAYLDKHHFKIDYAIKYVPSFKKKWHEFIHMKLNKVKNN